jgi:hypothetical protein
VGTGHVFLKEVSLWHLPADAPHGRLGPPVPLPRKFDPVKDLSVTLARPQDETGWFLQIDPNRETIRLFDVENPAVDDGAALVLRGRLGTSGVKGAHLQLVCYFPDGTESASAVPKELAEGDTNPTLYEVRHALKPGERPYLIRLNLVMKKSDKEQSVFLKELELSQTRK